ncbi:hypothetical protein J6590_023720 [Homalodisca vitripennis]|nr:hypothetical protein J6590_023720 [Homalodisca vitripennis]
MSTQYQRIQHGRHGQVVVLLTADKIDVVYINDDTCYRTQEMSEVLPSNILEIVNNTNWHFFQ